MKMYVRYEHHGEEVTVRDDLRGKHREYCLCWNCELFKPQTREGNCEIANANFANCVKYNVVLPVWECPRFVLKY